MSIFPNFISTTNTISPMAKNIFKSDDLQSALGRIESVQPDSKARWGKMNTSQMICHCADQIRVALGDVSCKDTGNVFHHTILKWMVLAGFPFPKGKVETMPEISQEKGGTPPRQFEEDKKTLVELTEKMAAVQQENAFVKHPIFGKMSNKEWGRLVYIHLDHHLGQFGR